jgi:hypothetical protein
MLTDIRVQKLFSLKLCVWSEWHVENGKIHCGCVDIYLQAKVCRREEYTRYTVQYFSGNAYGCLPSACKDEINFDSIIRQIMLEQPAVWDNTAGLCNRIIGVTPVDIVAALVCIFSNWSSMIFRSLAAITSCRSMDKCPTPGKVSN